MKLLALKLSLCLLTLSLTGCGNESDPASVVVGNRAPDFALMAIDGTTMKSNSLQGEVVILNFWATYCGPCKVEIPELNQIAATSKAKVIGIALDENGLEAINPFMKEHPINYPVLLGDQEVFGRFNGVGIPYTLILDRQQNIFKIYRGATTRESLEADLKSIESGAEQRAAVKQ